MCANTFIPSIHLSYNETYSRVFKHFFFFYSMLSALRDNEIKGRYTINSTAALKH